MNREERGASARVCVGEPTHALESGALFVVLGIETCCFQLQCRDRLAVMNTLTTIPKQITKGEELVVIPRKEYDELQELKQIREFTPTRSQKRALELGRKNRARGNFLTIDELGRKLGIAS